MAINQGATIDFQNIHLNFGEHRVSGYMGTAITVSYNVDAFIAVVGVDGLGAWLKTSDNSAVITVTLMPNSVSNNEFSGFYTLDRNTDGGALRPVILREIGGLTLYSSAAARIVKLPDFTRSDGIEGNAWTIGTTNLEGFVGSLEPKFAAAA